MKKSIIQIIFASLVLISFISCNPGVNPDSNQNSNIKPFALNLSQFNQPENDMGTYNTETHVLSIDDIEYLQKRDSNIYYWLNYLDATEYNCVLIKYNSPEYGFVVVVQDDTKKLRGLYFLAGFGTQKQTIELKEIAFEYIENVKKN